MISMILATSNDLAIGDTSRPDGLPWDKNPEDLAWFSSLTKGSVVVMGGKTFRQLQDIGFANGLPKRFNYVISNSGIDTGNFLTGHDTRYRVVNYGKLEKYLKSGGKDYFIIGGKSIYEQLHPYCELVYLTRIEKYYPDADVRINLDFLSEFAIVNTKKLNEYSHVEVWERKK